MQNSNNMHQMSSSSLSALRFVPSCRKLYSSLRLEISSPQILLNSSMILAMVRWSLKFSCSLMAKSTSPFLQQLFSGLQCLCANSYTSLRLLSSSSNFLCTGLLFAYGCSCSCSGVSMVFSRKSQQLDSSASLFCTLELIFDSAKFRSSTFQITLSSFFQRCNFSRMWSQGLTSFYSWLDSYENLYCPFFYCWSILVGLSWSQGISRLILVLASYFLCSSFLKVLSALDFSQLVGSCLMGLEVLRDSPFPSDDSTRCRSWQKRSRLKLAFLLSALP